MITYTYTYKQQGDGSDSWIQEVTENAEIVDVEVVYMIKVLSWKLKAVLTIEGLINQVNGALNSLPEPDKTLANIAWDYAPEVESSSPMVLAIRDHIGLTNDQMITLFETAKNFKI